MPIVHVLEDLVRVQPDRGEPLVLAWGDPVEVLGREGTRTRVRVHGRGAAPFEGTVKGRLPTQPRGVLQFSQVDVQQGDGMVIETPAGRKLLVDGGDNALFARYLAARYRGTTAERPLDVDAIVVTHGDADHFEGLNKIRDSEKHRTKRKRLFLRPRRVFHNGLVKGPGKKGGKTVPDEKMFGRTLQRGSDLLAVDLADDLRRVAAGRLNGPFRRWAKTLRHWTERGPIELRRLAFGDGGAFGFLEDEGIEVEVLGPLDRRVRDRGKLRPALPFLREPPKTVEVHLGEPLGDDRRFSASHTINGHSVALRLRFGHVRFLLTGDLNQEAMAALRAKVKRGGLKAEIVKAPHHGSADFDLKALRAMAPVVSIISSGDESARKEHIHPRATLLGALGRVGRGDTSLVFCTELAAFFAMRGPSRAIDTGRSYFGFERTSFGIVQVRTDGERVLVFTHSGKETLKEAYRFTVDRRGRARFQNLKKR